jgi:hypothetical protein
MNELPTREVKIRAIHQVMHPGVGWDSCDKVWCKRRIPAFVDDRLIDRDDIDYEAAEAVLIAWVDDDMIGFLMDAVEGIVNAALGIGER